MTHSSTDPEAFFEEWLLAYDSMLVDDFSASLPSSSRSDPIRDAKLQKAQICLQLLELDRLSLGADDSDVGESPGQRERSPSTPSSEIRSSENDHARQRFQRFQLIRRLGTGGFGIVFLAEDPTLKRLVAIKVPRPEALATESRRKRFIEESRLVASLNHPHIVPIHEAGTFGPFCFQVLAYCSAGSLADWLKRGPSAEASSPSEGRVRPQRVLPEKAAIRLMCSIVEAVKHAHERGVLHCDLKPSNILLFPRQEIDVAGDGDGNLQLDDSIQSLRPMISDFGLARVYGTLPPSDGFPGAASDPPSGMSLTTLAGTVPYMAPEQCITGLGPIREGADVFGLGAILYELLSGRPPFEDALEKRTEDGLPQPLQDLRPDLSNALQAVVSRALEPRTKDRFASAEEFLAALKSCIEPQPPTRSLASIGASRSRWLSALKIILLLSFLGLGIGASQRFLGDPQQAVLTERRVLPVAPEEGATFTPGGNVFEAPVEYDGQSPITIELWCRPQAPKGLMLSWCGLVSISSDDGRRGVGPAIGVLPNEQEIALLQSCSPLTTNRWHHLAAVYDGQYFRLFVDGQTPEMSYQWESDAGIRQISDNPAFRLKTIWPGTGLTIGSNGLGSAPKHRYHFHGAIREVRLSKGVRYHETFTPQPNLSVDSETIALYRLKPDSPSIPDASGHQKPLRLVPQPSSASR